MDQVRAGDIDELMSAPGESEARPTPNVAPERKGRRDLTVVRQSDETDADYVARCELVALLIDAVEQG